MSIAITMVPNVQFRNLKMFGNRIVFSLMSSDFEPLLYYYFNFPPGSRKEHSGLAVRFIPESQRLARGQVKSGSIDRWRFVQDQERV